MTSSSKRWLALVLELESKAGAVQGSRMKALELKQKVEAALREAESKDLAPELLSRLDLLLVNLTAEARENVCTNPSCPYFRKCRMK
jgi:hypothetical protein